MGCFDFFDMHRDNNVARPIALQYHRLPLLSVAVPQRGSHMEPEEPGDELANDARQLISELSGRPLDTFYALTPVFYERLRRLAKRYMSRERRDHTFQSTEVVHEALARLNQRGATFADSKHFYLTVATQIRWFLVDHARARRTRPKKSDASMQVIESGMGNFTESDAHFLDLHEALSVLEHRDPELSEVCDLYYFGGHTATEMALMLGVSESTITRRLRLLKAWLSMYMKRSRPHE